MPTQTLVWTLDRSAPPARYSTANTSNVLPLRNVPNVPHCWRVAIRHLAFSPETPAFLKHVSHESVRQTCLSIHTDQYELQSTYTLTPTLFCHLALRASPPSSSAAYVFPASSASQRLSRPCTRLHHPSGICPSSASGTQARFRHWERLESSGWPMTLTLLDC
ncbi:hypothetical protein BDP81DRAFT_427599 [Colletotrichum phormii]|uniref:Uncharacterized protein n=1 Tax=Colletotrichum phormii TaxID=359342 RepID=A0AAJ0EEW7_9PEZI|nr:uncharacterized protein BDP81DRAFT_427599 [Colletotrichum phormii]KAK1636429.1 hypothetical protein BDP81DRAFT_427599 [Colletotrichum phormii]